MERRMKMRPWGIGMAYKFQILKQVLNSLFISLFMFAAINNLWAEELKHQYYLLAETGHKPMCVVDVHINDEHIMVVEPEVKKEIMEITSFVKKGDNEVVFEVEALPDEGDDYGTIDIQIGSGTYKNGNLSWEALSVNYSVSRAQLKKEKKEVITTSLKFSAN